MVAPPLESWLWVNIRRGESNCCKCTPGTRWLLTLQEVLPIPGTPGVMGLGARALPELRVMIGRLATAASKFSRSPGLHDPLSCSHICSFGRDGGGGRQVGPPTRAGGVAPKMAGPHSWQVGAGGQLGAMPGC